MQTETEAAIEYHGHMDRRVYLWEIIRDGAGPVFVASTSPDADTVLQAATAPGMPAPILIEAETLPALREIVQLILRFGISNNI